MKLSKLKEYINNITDDSVLDRPVFLCAIWKDGMPSYQICSDPYIQNDIIIFNLIDAKLPGIRRS